MNPLNLLSERRSTSDPTLGTAATEGKRHHETLYGEEVRRRLNLWRVVWVLIGINVWMVIDGTRLRHEKLYVPVPMGERTDGRKYWLGMPDPAWRPDDHDIVAELRWLVQTIRGRTRDADFDLKQWHYILAHCTTEGQESLRRALTEIEQVEEKGRIEVMLLSITKYSEQTFDVRWAERRYNETNKFVRELRFQGLFRVLIDVPKTLKALETNISGVWHDSWEISPDKG